jgi:putative transcriptional regulator
VNKKLFAELVESMTQMNEIVRGERAPSREFHVDAIAIKSLRSKIGLSQPKFAALLHVNVGTLRNWEQGLIDRTAVSSGDPLDIPSAEHLIDSGDAFGQGTFRFFVRGRGGLARVTVLRRER